MLQLFSIATLILACTIVIVTLGACEPEEPVIKTSDLARFDGIVEQDEQSAEDDDDGDDTSGGGGCELLRTDADEDFVMTGKWVERADVHTLSDVPLIGKAQETGSLNYFLHTVVQEELSAETEIDLCYIYTKPIGSTQQTKAPQALTDSIKNTAVEIELGGFEIAEGIAFAPGPQLILWGLRNMEDPFNEPLPDSRKDPRVYDADRDGNEGVTMLIEGIIDGEVYVIQRSISDRLGTVRGPDTIAGVLHQESEQIILRANPSALEQPVKTYPDPDLSASTFVMLRVSDGCTCDGVLKNYEQWFEEYDSGLL